ncbi:ABC transporter ATP-binding protein [Schaalia sp. 19OD2882]|uniref:ABC transporter ATP-binding protein n=1 Tax=Schaalia sp. 19OD2882 TaxID=2794089 RepID=UPI001C1E9BB2|nr:ABC transporter ATP-binding protein [Schaalia sp. 19OD2882]QWW20029.1 ABC transporter ATP-binding protein [Schaalia sp. 19OD2882]
MRLPIADDRTVRAYLVGLFSANRGSVALVVVLQLLASGALALLPVIIGQVVDGALAGTLSASSDAARIIALVLTLVAVSVVAGWLSEYKAMALGEHVFAQMRERLVASAMALPLSVVEEAGTGDLLGRTTHDVPALDFLVKRGTYRILYLVVTGATSIITSLVVAPELGWMLVAQVLLAWPIIVWYLRRTVPVYRSSSARFARLSGIVAESIDGAESVRALGMGRVRMGHLLSLVDEIWRMESYGAWARMFMAGMLMTALHGATVAAIALGALQVGAGWTSVGAVSTVVLLSAGLVDAVSEATYWTSEFQTGWVSLGRIAGVELVERDRSASGRTPADSHMRARSVGYAYRDGHPVLHEVDLDLVAGETLAIVGPSGAGKSTLGRLIAGIHPPSSGSVEVGGVPLVDLDETALRSEVALVTQEHHVFVGSIADNLRIARADASDQEVLAALESVGAGEWVAALDEGATTKVGSDGLELSPSQAQQLALARLLLLDPHTVVLDEATSLMDPTAARTVEASLGRALEGRTVVAIAHRLHTAHDADRIAVMLEGRIVELGTHDELVALGGEYASLWNTWNRR